QTSCLLADLSMRLEDVVGSDLGSLESLAHRTLLQSKNDCKSGSPIHLSLSRQLLECGGIEAGYCRIRLTSGHDVIYIKGRCEKIGRARLPPSLMGQGLAEVTARQEARPPNFFTAPLGRVE